MLKVFAKQVLKKKEEKRKKNNKLGNNDWSKQTLPYNFSITNALL